MFHTKRTLIRILLCTCLIIVLSTAPALASFSAMINNSGAKIYSSSGSSGSLRKGTTVTVKDIEDGWAKITYKGLIGYVKTKYLTAKNGATGYASKNANVYAGASSSTKIIASVS